MIILFQTNHWRMNKYINAKKKQIHACEFECACTRIRVCACLWQKEEVQEWISMWMKHKNTPKCIHVCKWVHELMRAHVHAVVCVYIYIYIYIYIYLFIYVCVCAFVHVCARACVRECVRARCVCVWFLIMRFFLIFWNYLIEEVSLYREESHLWWYFHCSNSDILPHSEILSHFGNLPYTGNLWF